MIRTVTTMDVREETTTKKGVMTTMSIQGVETNVPSSRGSLMSKTAVETTVVPVRRTPK